MSIAELMGQPLTMLERASAESMVLSTTMSRAFIARIAMLSLAAVVILTKARRGLTTAALFHGLALVTLAWNGHAAATECALGLVHRVNDGLHLVAAGLWIGAIGWFLNLVIAAHSNPRVTSSQKMPEHLTLRMHCGVET